MVFRKIYHRITIITLFINVLLLPINPDITLKYLKDGRFYVICKKGGIIHTAHFLPNANFVISNEKIFSIPDLDIPEKMASYICSRIESDEQSEQITKIFTPSLPVKSTKSFRVVLDPGHGGKFTGTAGMAITEKDLNLDIALRVYNLLKDKYDVLLTRTTDTELGDSLNDDLNERINIAHKNWADLFISIHHNFAYNSYVRGFEIYLPTSSNWIEKAKKIENISSVIVKNGFEEPRHYYEYIKNATNKITGIMIKKLSNLLPSNGVKNKNLRVLRENLVPAILIEVEYLSNPDAENFLLNFKNRQKIAIAIAEAIDEYFKNYSIK